VDGAPRLDDLVALPMIERLIAFDTTSRESNLELIEWARAYLEGHGASSALTYDDTRQKANLFATFPAQDGNATSGGLTTPYSGPLPNGYSPMKTDSSILLGTGGDNSHSGVGMFFEGAVTAGYPSDATENAVQATITAAGYSFTGGSTGGQQIVGAQSGRCVDLPNGSETNGAQVQLYDCNGQSSQRWTYGSDKRLVDSGGKCLDASGRGTTNGTKVIIWDCNGQANQQWNVNASGTITGVQSGLCLDANGASTANGTMIILWSCNGQANQQWSLRS